MTMHRWIIYYSQKNINEKFTNLPTMDDIAQFVTWPQLEDALTGVKRDWETMQQERVVIEMSSQTEPAPVLMIHFSVRFIS